ncbi:MAG: hypothetical protein ABW033_00600 [Acidimicrobiia bacterium]
MVRRAFSALSAVVMTGAFVTMGAVVTAGPAAAETYEGVVEYTCTTFTAAGTGADILDRDNTGSGVEAARIDVIDGTGAVIYTLNFSNPLGTYGPGLIDTTNYTTPPAANPITMYVTSLAGNGLPEEVNSYGSGTCDEIPTANCEVPAPPTEVEGTAAGRAAGAAAAVPAVCGDLVVTKTVVGTADPGTTFNVQVACTAPPVDEEIPTSEALPEGHVAPFSTTLTFPETGGTQTLTITDGASCTVTEAVQPPGCTLVSITPPSAVIEADTTRTVAVTDQCEITIKPVVVQPRFTG